MAERTCLPALRRFDRITPVKGERIGLRRCDQSKKQFTVKVGTVFESSHVPLHQWLQASYLMCSSKKGISSHQLMRTLGVQYKTAWFMTHRIREAMADDKLPMMGGLGKVAEIDEAFIGQKKDMPKRRGYAHKHALIPSCPAPTRAAGPTPAGRITPELVRVNCNA